MSSEVVAPADRLNGTGRWVAWLIGFGLFVILAMTLVLGRQVISDLEEQRSATSDNVQWTLTQVEVEFLSFLISLEHYGHSDDTPEEPTNVSDIRRDFDVFYSRVYTLNNASLFKDLRAESDFSEPLSALTRFLEETVLLIDGPTDRLRDELGALLDSATGLSDDVRDLSVSGLAYFARQSDARRSKTANTLMQLAAFSGGLLLALATVSLYLMSRNRTIHRNNADMAQVNQRMNTVLSTSLDAVIVSNAAGEVLEFNPAAENIFGYSADDARGRSIGELIVPKHLRQAHNAGMERMRKGGDKHVVGKGRVQLEAMRANGEIFPVELALQSARSGEHEIVIGFIRDISRRVADEQELITARDEALAGQKAKEDFLTVMSHEIRTPLNGVLGNLSLLKNSRLTKEQRQFVRNMEISGEVMLNHVNSVLDIARFDAGKMNLEAEALDLNQLFQELVDSQSGSAASHGNVLRWRWVGTPAPWVKVDAQRLRQIVLNLVGNALKFTQDGQVTLEVEVTSNNKATEESIFELRVIDTGVGIPEAEIGKIFDDFHTVNTALDRTSEGTGLGLGIARRLVESMGGEIGVESEIGAGSVFWVHLPLALASPPDETDALAIRGETTGPLDLLVVEDNEINLMVIQKMLERDGHKVTIARDGKSGVDLAASRAFDAILMDISMPVMDGLTATRHIREGNRACAKRPIIAVSANVLPDAVEKFTSAGMNAFVSKPIEIDSLRKALAFVLDKDHASVSSSAPLSRLEQMRNDLGDAAFKRLLDRFVSETEALMVDLREAAWGHGDQTALKMECHRIAGSAAMFDAEDLREVLIDIENAVETSAFDDLSRLTHRAKGVWATTRKRLPGIS